MMAFAVKTWRTNAGQRGNLARFVAWWFRAHAREILASLRGHSGIPADLVLAETWGGVGGLLGAYSRSAARARRIRASAGTER